jgi:hypothetical protein
MKTGLGKGLPSLWSRGGDGARPGDPSLDGVEDGASDCERDPCKKVSENGTGSTAA